MHNAEAKFLQRGKGCHHKFYALPGARIWFPRRSHQRRGPKPPSTDATVDLEKSASVMAAFRDRLPIGRSATPDEVAGVIAFLASEDALFINGVNLPVDGGLHASNGQPNFLSILGQG
jgi:NAD(P)-dependent dehydrogenase (short-subunit alcohol dehydrogenase family)